MVTRITENGQDLVRSIDLLLRRGLPRETVQAAMMNAMLVLEGSLRTETVRRLSKDPTGALARSWRAQVTAGGVGPIQGFVGTALPYAEIHNRGGIIRPRRGKYLAIPLRPPIPRGQRGLMPRNDPTPMRAWRSRSGKLFLWSLKGSDPRPRYLLVSSVKIPATRYIDIATQHAQRPMHDAFADYVDRALRAAAQRASR